MNEQIKVMIVDDAFMIRVILRNMLESDEQKRFRVVASVLNGVEAVEKASKEEIDVILMDVEMPRKNGLEALKEIMEQKPTPVIMFSSLTKKGAKETIEALSLGAVDFITKSTAPMDAKDKNLKEELYEKIVAASKTNRKNIRYMPRTLPKKEEYTIEVDDKRQKVKAKAGEKVTNIIAIGCSTGGPTALQKVLSQIPKDMKAAIMIVQHMPPGGYTASLAEHLNQMSDFEVKEATDGDEILDGHVYIAPGGFHLELFKRGEKYQCVLNKREPNSGHRPSVDTLFVSISRIKNTVPIYGVILTGMGSDGTNGCHALKRENAIIIAESEKTAVIYGMPKQVVKRGLADYEENLENIVPRLIKIVK